MKKDKKILPFVLLSVSLICVLSFSFAWFVSNADVSIGTENEFAIESGYSLTISRFLGMVIDPENPTEEIESWSEYGISSSFTTSSLKDVTGDGYTFASPYSLVTTFDEDEHVVGRDEAVFPMYEVEESKHDRYYIEEVLKFKTNMACSIYLSNSSAIVPKGAENASSYSNENMSIKLPAYSSNNIAGAVRVAFLENVVSQEQGQEPTENLTLRQLWIPNSQYQLKYSPTTLDATDFDINGVREDSYGYLTNNTDPEHTHEAIEHTYTGDDFASKKVAVGNNIFYNQSTSMVNRATPLITFDNDTGEYYEKKLTIRIWIEGTDREANEAFNMGKFKTHITFSSLTKQASSSEDTTFLNSITVDTATRTLSAGDTPVTAANNVMYSPDGIDWFDYLSAIPTTYSAPSNGVLGNKAINEIYVKLKETVTLEHSAYKKLSMVGEAA